MDNLEKIFQLSMRLQEAEGHLSRVVLERDKLRQGVQLIANEVGGRVSHLASYHDPKADANIFRRIRKILRSLDE